MNAQQLSREPGPSQDSPASPPRLIGVLAVDDHPAIQEALAATIRNEADMTLCGQTRFAKEAYELIREKAPDVVVLDVALRDANGLELIQRIRNEHDPAKVVVFSMYDENAYAERAIRAGASSYVMKSEPTKSVVEAIRCVVRGEVYLSHRMASRILTKIVRGEGSQPTSPLDALTDREMSVFQMLGEGFSVQEIAKRLHLSRKTVETYRRRVKEKFRFNTLSELVQYAIHWSYSQGGPQAPPNHQPHA